MGAKILVVEDEPAIADLLIYNLGRANYSVSVAGDGQAAIDLAARMRPDLVILDVMLPKVDGLEVCRTLRRNGDVPIIMLTALDSELDRVVGLELGADDYVVKPFSVRELLARVKNILRRAAPPTPETESKSICVGGLAMNAMSREAHWKDSLLELTTLEFNLLYTLATHTNQVLSREKLLEMVWGYDYYGDARTVDAVVKRLRLKLSQAAQDSNLIVTVRGVGYKLTSE
ncbi:MAG TPA: response regulator transcription factor [Anaerolineales bacterium]|nr:response regulator transcription factor [Anaerolineales bacterium]